MEVDFNKRFEEEYKKLNKKQKEAVDTIEGPVMVIAGPGTGKTTILTLRIANIIRITDTRPEQILALTFTESGVQSMRTKLIDIIGPVAYKVNIFTFHGFANFIIKKYPDEFPRIISHENASEVEKIGIIEGIVDAGSFDFIKPYGDIHFYVPSLLTSIKHLKRENVSIEQFENLIKKNEKEYEAIDDLIYESGAHKGKVKGKYKDIEKNIKKNKELLEVYKAYERELALRKLYDFDDMLLELIKAMRSNESFLLSLQEEYQYILADEHQDANNSQNSILELLASFHQNPNIFIVGDEKQAIFRFQGASLENFLYFQDLYKDVKLVRLVNNYRSTQSILDASHELISHNEASAELRTELTSKGQFPELPIGIIECEDESAEREYVVGEVQKLIDEGVQPKDIAVLFRKNKEADALIVAFALASIPFAVYSDRNVLQDHEIRKLLLVLSAINNPSNDALIGEISFFDVFGLPLSSIYKAFEKSRREKISVLEAYQGDNTLSDFAKKIWDLTSRAKNEDTISFFEIFFDDLQWGAKLMATRDPIGGLSSYNAFLNEVQKYSENNRGKRLSDFLSYLKTVEDYKIRISAGAREDRKDAVSLMTAHKSKGLEFEQVFITGATDKNWGNIRDMKKFDLPYTSSSHIEDDRRLFYVALTRAKRKAYVTYSQISLDGKTYLPSQFLLELKQNLTAKKRYSHSEGREKRPGIGKRGSELLFDKEYLRTLFLNETFSVTALNNYISCPWKYFFRNLIRLPELQTKHQLYGTAVHDTLRELCLSFSKRKVMTKDKLIKVFGRELEKKPLSKRDFEESLAKGEKALSGYFDAYSSTWVKPILCEYNVSGVEVEVPKTSQSVILRGVIDKIELSIPDPFKKQDVHVVDYKTAKPKTRNEIEGKTKNATGDYKRQLIFYKLLLKNEITALGGNLYNVRTGEIDFIEPDDGGKYRKEIFEISEGDVSEIHQLISETLGSIYKMEFFDEGCNKDECEECKFAKSFLLK